MTYKNLLFICSGSPYRYPIEHINDHSLRESWRKGFRSQLLHPLFFDRSYALYLGERNEIYKLCSGVIVVVIKKSNFKFFPKLSSFINSIKIFMKSRQLHKRLKFTAVETYLPGSRLLTTRFISKRLSIPMVVQCQGDFDLSSFEDSNVRDSIKKFIGRHLQKFIFSLAFQQADLVLAYSDHCASFSICNGASPDKVRRLRIHSFLEHFEHTPLMDQTAIKGLDSSSPMVFLWCRLAPENKLNYSLEAMKLLLEKRPDVRFLIAGDGVMRNELESRYLDLKEKIVFLGHINRDILKSYIHFSDVCLAPIAGHSLVEAGVCKKAVVAFNWEWHTEAITHMQSGLLVDYPNINKFSESILYLLDNKEHALSMGDKLYKRVKFLFNEERVCKREAEIWDEFKEKLETQK